MEIYPIHLRKKRSNISEVKTVRNHKILQLNKQFENLFKDLDHLKQHLLLMEKKYKPDLLINENVSYQNKEDR
jgi:hypothetical protein